MSFLDNEYKKRFSKRTMPVEPDLQDNLWEQIAGELGKETTEGLPAPKSNFRLRHLGWGVLLMVGAWGIYQFYANGTNDKRTPTTEVAAQSNTVVVPSAGAKSHTILPATHNGAAQGTATPIQTPETYGSWSTHNRSGNTASAKSNDQPGTNPIVTLLEDVRTENKSIGATAIRNEEKSNTNAVERNNIVAPSQVVMAPQSPDDNTSNINPQSINDAAGHNNTVTTSRAATAPQSPDDNTSNVNGIQATWPESAPTKPDPLALLPMAEMNVWPNTVRPPVAHYAIMPPLALKKKTRSYPFQLGLMGGGSVTQFQYRANGIPDSIARIKQASEQSVGGHVMGVQFGFIRNGWSIGTGLEYQTTWSKLNYESRQVEYIFKANQLLEVYVDSISGGILKKIYGDTTVAVESRRTVVHYNRVRQWAIPIELGYQKQTDKWVYGIVAGPTLHFTTAQAGKLLDSERQITLFNQDSTLAPYKKMGIGVRVAPVIGYRPTSRITLFLRPQWGMQFNNQLDNNALKGRYQQFNLTVGVRFGF